MTDIHILDELFFNRTGVDKLTIREEISSRFGYDLSRTIDEIRPDYEFDVSCQGSVPEALIAFLDTPDPETAVRSAISLGGDADTQAAIAGAAAAAFAPLPATFVQEVRRRIENDMLEVLDEFESRYGPPAMS